MLFVVKDVYNKSYYDSNVVTTVALRLIINCHIIIIFSSSSSTSNSSQN